MKYQYKIRTHHGMCMAFFQGKGYSSEFTAHMGEIIHKLESNPTICISTQTDIICSKCPKNKQGLCETERKVIEYDRQVLKYCGLSEGTVMPYADFKKAVYENILIPNKREEMCGNCQWNELCHFNAEQ
ncbi:MAG: DUF1284 domain-containing protein [Clostridia bacterium]|nr:DUF1284 domain-containing protein [Clostridia bacterium]